MKCSDIPSAPILAAMAQWPPDSWCYIHDGYPRYIGAAFPAEAPFKLRLAKMRMLIRSGHIDGCGCGCRGDFVLTAKGRASITTAEAKP